MTMMILERPKSGPVYRFVDADVFYVLSILSGGRRIGRKRIGKELGIGEGSVRRLVTLMREYDLVKVEQPGITISKFGEGVLNEINIRMIHISMPDQVIGDYQQGLLVKGKADKVYCGIEQRNAGIRAGGEGCTTWIMRNGKLLMAPDWDMDSNEPAQALKIRSKIDMHDGDVLIVGGGIDPRAARIAAIDAALEIV